MAISHQEIIERFKGIQDSICNRLEHADGTGSFHEDLWDRPGGGGGRTRILNHGNVIEKGGVNFSAVHGDLPDRIQKALGVNESRFLATGVSIVIHPNNPHVPIIHMNIRYFELKDGTYWFGGGIDLTPHYVNKQDASYFHSTLKEICDHIDSTYYSRFKSWADDYFFIKHRGETRGIGGIFFDRLNDSEGYTKEELLDFVCQVGESFAPIYTRFMKEHSQKTYTDSQKNWQLLRRGRYVEFNLVYDKGTKFGLETSGRIESILMSLPEMASWQYNVSPEPGSAEEETINLLKKNINWINLNN